MQTTTKTVRVIPATKGSLAEPALVKQIKKRVCAYARVSTDSDEQQTSYEAQVDHYTRHIQSNDQWIYCGVYADDGVSATSTKKRNGFNQMISDALDGKVDLIITKSVSRFARNTVDTLTTVRKLKEKGVEVFFQKENIYTLDSKGELLITIMSSLAQEESRSISENVTWGVRKRFSDGKVSMPYKRFLGYEKGPDGTPAIVEEEARLVRIIYRLFLFGKSPSYIASFLTEEGIPTPSGKEKWHPTVIISILTNEKYRGDALLQKRITVDFLTKTQKLNEGEAPQYLVHNSHPAIVEPEVFDLVQHEISRRRTTGRWGSSVHPFSGKIVCGCCGQTFGSKVWHSTSEYRRLIWRCNKKYEQAQPCDTPHLSDDQIKAVFLEAFNQRLTNKAKIISSYDDIIQALADTTELDAEESALLEERDVVMELKRKCIQENAASAQDQEDYRKRYDALHQRHENASARLAEIETIRLERNAKRINITRFLNVLARQGNELVKDFDEELWYIVVDSVTVHADGKMAVKFRDEEEILIAPSKWKSA